MFETQRDSRDLYSALLKTGVIIRPMGPERLRVTIGLPEENKRFVAELERIIKA
jgi:histidinol-phosphate aminotransferase